MVEPRTSGEEAPTGTSTSRLRLPVVIPPGTGQNFSCHSCTRCCRELLVEVSEADRARIDRLGWTQSMSMKPYVHLQGRWVLNKHADGRCVFLMDDGKCEIHARSSFADKPLPCRLYPFLLVPTEDRVRVTWRFDCPSVAASKGKPVREHAADVESMAEEVLADRTWRTATIELQRGVIAEPGELDALDRALDSMLTQPRLSLFHRMLGLIWMAESLTKAKLERVRRDRFQTLVEVLSGSWPEEVAEYQPATPSANHWALFRQFAFAHSGFISMSDMKGGWKAKLGIRWRQLKAAERFRKGVGALPPLAHVGLTSEVAFDAVSHVTPGAEDAAIGECLLRYVRSRVLSRTLYGPSYYRWPASRGLAAMGLAVAVVGWWARAYAAARGSRTIAFEDMSKALAMVDGAAGRIPALGSITERMRVDHLLQSGAIGHIVRRYYPTAVVADL